MAPIHHVVTGDGPPIVLVHGFACAHGDWDAQVVHLSPRYRTIVVDLRGHGMSSGTADECSIERYGADVAELMHALEVPRQFWWAIAWDAVSFSRQLYKHRRASQVSSSLMAASLFQQWRMCCGRHSPHQTGSQNSANAGSVRCSPARAGRMQSHTLSNAPAAYRTQSARR